MSKQFTVLAGVLCCASYIAIAQLIDRTTAPNAINAGIAKSLSQQIGAGRGDINTPDSSAFIIARDPFRSIRRGRQLFQRKFTRAQGQGAAVGDGHGNINTNLAIGAGLADSCASCHGRPRGSAGFGGDVVTRPDSRDAPHLFGLGLKEMLADEITTTLRQIRTSARTLAQTSNAPVTLPLASKGIRYGSITANPNGTFDTSRVEGVNPDLRVRPFFAHGGTISIREFIVGAFQNEMGLQSVDSELTAAVVGATFTTPSGMVLNGALDALEAPPTNDPNTDPDGDGVKNEVPVSLVDYMEFYLLNYFKAGSSNKRNDSDDVENGHRTFQRIGCTSCHVEQLKIDRDRRVADLETVYDPLKGIFNQLFATATPLFNTVHDTSGFPDRKLPKAGSFEVNNIFADFKRHDVGPNFYERNYDGTTQKQFMTTPLWGVGSTSPYGHDGRSISLEEVILRHGGEAQSERNRFAALRSLDRGELIAFLNSLVLFPPEDTASSLDPGNKLDPNFPQNGHGSIKLTVLFNNPIDIE